MAQRQLISLVMLAALCIAGAHAAPAANRRLLESTDSSGSLPYPSFEAAMQAFGSNSSAIVTDLVQRSYAAVSTVLNGTDANSLVQAASTATTAVLEHLANADLTKSAQGAVTILQDVFASKPSLRRACVCVRLGLTCRGVPIDLLQDASQKEAECKDLLNPAQAASI
ncbi:hypothetical protein N2152v2_007774 [Parachlorella kessleri]